MAEAGKEQDQSMEDILQSIKRIIAEEGEFATESSSGSDVLELTELLADDGSISSAASEDRAPHIESVSIDDIISAPAAAAPAPATVPAPQPVAAPAVEPSAPATDESLISGEALSASVAALAALRDSMTPVTPRAPATHFRSGTTVEDLVLETLKPMLKDWLDHHLPGLVETLVQREISKLNQR
jgi:cell pole-organizing protein PopZ